jgi:hypothetical protein
MRFGVKSACAIFWRNSGLRLRTYWLYFNIRQLYLNRFRLSWQGQTFSVDVTTDPVADTTHMD